MYNDVIVSLPVFYYYSFSDENKTNYWTMPTYPVSVNKLYWTHLPEFFGTFPKFTCSDDCKFCYVSLFKMNFSSYVSVNYFSKCIGWFKCIQSLRSLLSDFYVRIILIICNQDSSVPEL